MFVYVCVCVCKILEISCINDMRANYYSNKMLNLNILAENTFWKIKQCHDIELYNIQAWVSSNKFVLKKKHTHILDAKNGVVSKIWKKSNWIKFKFVLN
jgi:hypothetical protein